MEKMHFVPPNGDRRPTATTRLSLEWRCQHQVAPTDRRSNNKDEGTRETMSRMFNLIVTIRLSSCFFQFIFFSPRFPSARTFLFNLILAFCVALIGRALQLRTYSCSRFAASEASLDSISFRSLRSLRDSGMCAIEQRRGGGKEREINYINNKRTKSRRLRGGELIRGAERRRSE